MPTTNKLSFVTNEEFEDETPNERLQTEMSPDKIDRISKVKVKDMAIPDEMPEVKLVDS